MWASTFRKTITANGAFKYMNRRCLFNPATASNYESVARCLETRGYHWDDVHIDKVQSQSFTISFSDEWNLLLERVQEITLITPSKEKAKSKTPWEHFQKVIHPDRNRKNELSFSKALFRALRSSLGKFVDTSGSNENLLILKNSQIGFGKGIQRKRLGFPDGYAPSKDSESDHGCFVLGSDSYLKSYNSGDVTDGEKEFWYDDLTAAVELKLDKTSCGGMLVYGHMYLQAPNLRREHGPLGQAMFYSMDVWHCLARRGVQVQSVPVVVLAGQSKEISAKSTKASIPICCLEAQIQIPEYCGDTFLYSVECIVSFDGTTGLNTNEASSASTALESRKSRDERGIALYLRTMRKGLEHAIEISKKRNISVPVSPVSLCCRNLLRVKSDVQLIASPIPCEDRLKHPFLHISQGELFTLTNPKKSTFSGIEPFHWFTELTENDILTDNCFVKVSCVSVHNTYVPLLLCKEALQKLFSACEKNSKLKEEIAKVLLGFSATNDLSLVSVMKNLKSKGFFLLDHRKIRSANKLPELWTAFCILVRSTLLPLAHEDIIHVDIRSTSEITHNILCHYNTANAMELCLIDFDSLILSRSKYISLVVQKNAVHWNVKWTSPYTYLFWQVLWIAYTWFPVPFASIAPECPPTEPNAQDFVLVLFTDKFYQDFKNWLGMESVDALKKAIESRPTNAAAIENALNILTQAFVRSVQK